MTTLLLLALLGQYPNLDVQQNGTKVGRVHTLNAGSNLTCTVAKNIATCSPSGSGVYPGGVCSAGQYETQDVAGTGPSCAQVQTSQVGGWPSCTSDQKLTAGGAAPFCANEKWLFTPNASDIYWGRSISVNHSNDPTAVVDARAGASYAGYFLATTNAETGTGSIKVQNSTSNSQGCYDFVNEAGTYKASICWGNTTASSTKTDRLYVQGDTDGLSVIASNGTTKYWQFDSTKATFPDATTQASAVPITDDAIPVGSGSAFAAKVLPSCSGTADALNYNNSTNTPACNTLTAAKVGALTTVRTTGDYTNSTTTASDVTGLAFTLNGLTNYGFRCTLLTDTAAATTGLQLNFTGPAAITSTNIKYSIATSATAEPAPVYTTAVGTVAGTAGTGPGATKVFVFITGVIVNGVNTANLQLQAKSGVAASAVNIRKGSWCEWF